MKMKLFPRWSALAFGLAAVAVLAGGVSFYRNARHHAWQDAEAKLRTIARSKADQLAQWRAERLADASVIMDSAYLSEGVATWMETKSPAEMEKLLNRLRVTAKHYHYRDILLVDAKGQVLLSVTGHDGRLHEEVARALAAALREQRAMLSDLHPGDGDLPVHLGVIAPIFAVGAETGDPLGAVVLQCDAEQYLYPLIQSWPVPSASGETVFCRRDGDDVLFLSPLRFQKDAALNLRTPLARKNVPTVMAVLGKAGFMEGMDYRGVEVLSFSRAIPDSPWFLVVKQDTSEVFAPLQHKALATAAVVALLILLLALAFGVVWHQRATNENLEQRVRARTAELRESEARYRSIFEDVPVSIWEEDWGGPLSIVERLRGSGVVDFRRYFDERPEVVAEAFQAVRILDVNAETVRMFKGKDKKGFLASLETVFATPDTLPGFVGELVALAEGKRLHETEMRLCTVHKDIVHVLLKMTFPPPGAASNTVFVSLMNITDRKLAEENAEQERQFSESVISSLPGVFYVIGAEGRFRRWNTNFETVTGYTHDEMSTLSPLDLFTGKDRQLIAERIQKTFELGEARAEADLVSKSGARRPYLFTGVRASFGGESLLVGMGLDISERKQAEDTLQASEERFRLLVDAITSVVWVTDAEGRFVEPQVEWEAYTGQTWEQHLDWGWAKALHPEDSERVGALWHEALAQVKPYEATGRIWCAAANDYHHFVARAVPRKNADGSVIEWIGTVMDIDARRRAEEELRVHRDHLEQLVAERTAQVQTQAREQAVILDSIPALVFYKDLENRIIRVNQDFADAMGMTRAQLEDKLCSELWPGQGAEYWKADQEVMALETAKRGIIEPLVTPQGTRWLRTDKVPFRDENGNITGIIGFSIDITERKLAEERILKLNEDLARRTTELEAVNHELEAFSYSVSHDLKAPLRSVDGFAQMLEEDYAARLDDEGRRLLKVVRDSARDMGQLVNDLLTFSRLSRKELTVGRLDLRRMVEDVRRQVDADAGERTIRWEVGDLPPAFGDEATLREVLINLLSNAVKYTRPRAEAVIGFAGHAEAGEVVYTVTDNGVGFDMAYKDKLFSVFQRLHTSDEFEGTGIGLALVQRIIQRHGGRVWAEGEVDKGARFSFTLPREVTNAEVGTRNAEAGKE